MIGYVPLHEYILSRTQMKAEQERESETREVSDYFITQSPNTKAEQEEQGQIQRNREIKEYKNRNTGKYKGRTGGIEKDQRSFRLFHYTIATQLLSPINKAGGEGQSRVQQQYVGRGYYFLLRSPFSLSHPQEMRTQRSAWE